MKILSPAGNMECLKMAVMNGADEVYLGINDFNARNNIDGFTIDNLKPAIDYAHIFGVKVYLALNILFSDQELEKALDIVCMAENMGIDAYIVQDLGLISLINNLYPTAEIHLSTQMGIHNLEGILALSKYKFKRVVLSRETPLSEIKRIKENSDVEIEYFVQGALCVSFSGNCYLSSYAFNASGNRGRCKQLCRLPYTLKKGGKKLKSGYLLSAKDFNMIDRLKDLAGAGVDAIKIEGRARRPFYVGQATRQYYNKLHGKSTDNSLLELAFNRHYVQGYFNGNGDIISDIQSHIGIRIGKVNKIEKGKKFNKIFFSSNRELSKKSTFKFFKDGQEKIITAFDLVKLSENSYYLTSTTDIEKDSFIHLIIDQKLESEMSDFYRKVSIKIGIIAEQEKNIKALVDLGQKSLEILGDKLEISKNFPLDANEIKSNFSKSEFFNADIEILKLEKVFITKQKLNDFRRKVFDEIIKTLTKVDKKIAKKPLPKLPKIQRFSDFKIVEKLDENFTNKNMIFWPDTYDEKEILEFKNKCKKQNKKPYLFTPNFALEKDVILLKNIIEKTDIDIVANNYYALLLTDKCVIGGGLNIYNHFSANELNKPFYSAESDIGERADFAFMTLRHCPMKNLINATCAKCPYEDGYEYVLESGKTLKLKRKKLSDCTFYLTD